ncbi:uncharacterized protein PHALS_13137 [Plasmopara halstedii]|uniref:Uncharacterized protein n=1 Tax=Plasmopara halstedii TaxID=4781 RepID=A0A0P1AP14_PLAHL|nr:uncharacterized protein PHALS_13137 [Plasmopara halstedii]CEG42901.1 hypothetical protein PHALS_13137 [Plasmopara halstedii]|eukprot:XP_024579270.1 hypothetical protein PHALS_13137 [Plasmopara halstedii]
MTIWGRMTGLWKNRLNLTLMGAHQMESSRYEYASTFDGFTNLEVLPQTLQLPMALLISSCCQLEYARAQVVTFLISRVSFV